MIDEFKPAAFTAREGGGFTLVTGMFLPGLDGFEMMPLRESMDARNWMGACVHVWLRSTFHGFNADSIYRGLTGHPGGMAGDSRWIPDDRTQREIDEFERRKSELFEALLAGKGDQ